MKIIFAWWWTWWHIFPSLAIASNLNDSDEKLFIISKNKLDEEILKKNNLNSKNHFNYKKISSWKLRRYFDLQNFFDIFKFIFWFFQSLKIILNFKPDLIFCKWWFVSLPVAIAGFILWKKIVLHESDSVMWIANKIIAKFCIWKKWKIFYWEKIWNPINFSEKINWKKFFSDNEKKRFIKEKIFSKIERKIKNFSEDDKKNIFNKKILFISWGSQWSSEINFLIEKRLEKIIEKDFFVIHLTWKWKKIYVNETNENLQKNYLWFEFLAWDSYFNFLKLSDLVISRAWAGSIAEILFFQKSSILIPLKSSAWNHQIKNAKKLEKEWLTKVFEKHFLDILNSDFSKIENNLKKKNYENPAKKISEEIKLIKNKKI